MRTDHRTFYALVMPLLRTLDPETAHNLALKALSLGIAGSAHKPDPSSLGIRALGMSFTNPIGLAAGFDKNCDAVLPLMKLGFGFVEAGTVTLQPQDGNSRPRMFRLPQHRAVINRLGFNNRGLESYLASIQRLDRRPARLGANVGINKEGADPQRDYPRLVAAVSPFVDYVTINISSPNTPGLRDLQGEAQLRGILQAVKDRVPVRPPMLIKIAPDLADDGLRSIVDVVTEFGVEGLIVSNTTISRPPYLDGPNAQQAGGLSGAPLFKRSTEVLRFIRRLAGDRLTLIGCGGIRTGGDILAKIQAGASLVQLYTEFAYVGPPLIARLKDELLTALDNAGFRTLAEAIGTEA